MQTRRVRNSLRTSNNNRRVRNSLRTSNILIGPVKNRG